MSELPFPNEQQNSGQRALAQHDLTALQVDLENQTQSTRRNHELTAARLKDLAASLTVREQAMKTNGSRLALTRNAYELGMITLLEVETVENSIYQSTQAYYDALLDYVDTYIDYARLHGKPLPMPAFCQPVK
jgi:outer membrane protein TolC